MIRAVVPLNAIGRSTTMTMRTFVCALMFVTCAPTSAVYAQAQSPLIGFVNNGSPKSYTTLVAAFRDGLGAAGFEEHRNVAIQYRWAYDDNSRLPVLIQNLIEARVSLIAATGGTPVPLAARNATKAVPVVFAIGADPVKMGLVASFNRPGGNITGVSFLANTLLAKQIEILHELAAKDAVLGYLSNPANPNAESDAVAVMSAVAKLGRRLVMAKATTPAEIDAAFAKFVQERVGALLIFPDALFTSNRERLIALLSQHKLPGVYNSREFAVAGGLIGYGANQTEAYRQAGNYAGRILKGEKPGDLPVVQSSSIQLVVNLKTAKILGVDVAQTLLARADEIIE